MKRQEMMQAQKEKQQAAGLVNNPYLVRELQQFLVEI